MMDQLVSIAKIAKKGERGKILGDYLKKRWGSVLYRNRWFFCNLVEKDYSRLYSGINQSFNNNPV
jgi:hypothetical protein